MRKKVVRRNKVGRPSGTKKSEQIDAPSDGIGDDLIAQIMHNDYEVLKMAGVEEKHIVVIRKLANNISAVGFALDAMKARKRELSRLVNDFKKNIPIEVGGKIVYLNVNDESAKRRAVEGKHALAKAGLRYSVDMLMSEFEGDSVIQKLENVARLQLEESNG